MKTKYLFLTATALWLFLPLATFAQKQDEQVGPYTVTALQKDVYHIEDCNDTKPSGIYQTPDGTTAQNNCSDMYLVVGRQKALLIDLSNWITWDDTAVESLRKIVFDRIGKKELIITFTHAHGDHYGMLPAFQDDARVRFIVPARDFLGDTASPTRRAFSLPELPKGRTLYIDDGGVLDLGGNVRINAVQVSGHTPGSMVFFLEGANLCFSGDAFGVWIFSYDGFKQLVTGVNRFIEYVEDPNNGVNPNLLAIWGGHSWQKRQYGIVGMQMVYDMRTLIEQIGAYQATPTEVHYSPYLTHNYAYGQALITWNAHDAWRYAEEVRFPTDADFRGTGPTHKDRNQDLTALFDAYTYTQDTLIGDMKYYLYDPIKHGADPTKKYPLMVVFHGANNGMNGVLCTTFTDCAVFAGPEYQKLLGEAYVLFPKANEGSEDGSEPVVGNWMTIDPNTGTSAYLPATTALVKQVLADNPAINHKQVVVGGTSAGGYMAWRFLAANAPWLCGAFLMAPADNPTPEELQVYETLELPIWIIHGAHDEICTFDRFTGPNMDAFSKMKNVRVSPISTVRYGDKGVVRMVVNGTEMGQHLSSFCVGANMLYDDGTPYDLRYPDGFIPWLKEAFDKAR